MFQALHRAACAGVDPRVFDAHRYPDADEGLAYCGGCPIREVCIEVVRPQKSHYDGICGGVVWRNGYRVRPDNSTREDRFILLRKAAAEGVA